MDFGIQLYGCTDIFRKDPEYFFLRAAVMGYTAIEPCVAFGAFDFPKDRVSPFLTPRELAAYAETAKAHGLRIDSCHVFGDLPANIEELNNVITTYGIKQVMTGGPKGNYQTGFDRYAEMLKTAAAGIRKTGARLCVHNGAAEIREKINGKTFLEAVLDRCGGEVGAQIDTGWVLYGGEDPLSYMKKIGPGLLSLHYKDIHKDYKNLPPDDIHICLGEGAVSNVREIFGYALERGVPQLIDQDKSRGDMMDDLEKSVTLLRSFQR